ncbi:hypothetical protein BZL39_D00370 [Zygosaccharomyces parabailii]|nr:hypothetical protein BZL39_D00370 [Zygosaccharomyces parabailii]CDH10524.1 uncharacterized protein ZBAI_02310 [Zygosaccharomyces bailii ISA1307]
MDDSDLIEFLLSNDEDSGSEYSICTSSDDYNLGNTTHNRSFKSTGTRGNNFDYASVGAKKKNSHSMEVLRKLKSSEIMSVTGVIITKEERLELEIDEEELFGNDKNKKRTKKKTSRGRDIANSLESLSEAPTTILKMKAKHRRNRKTNKAKNGKISNRRENSQQISSQPETHRRNTETHDSFKVDASEKNQLHLNLKKKHRSGRFHKELDNFSDEESRPRLPPVEEPRLEKSKSHKKKKKQPSLIRRSSRRTLENGPESFNVTSGTRGMEVNGKNINAVKAETALEESNTKRSNSQKRKSRRLKKKQEKSIDRPKSKVGEE